MLVQLRSRVPNTSHRKGKFVSEDEVAIELRDDADVYKPNGDPLLLLRRRAIPAEVCEAALPALRELKKYGSDNRVSYAGGVSRTSAEGRRLIQSQVDRGSVRGLQNRAIGVDGKAFAVHSSVVGYFDRQGGRFPFCRETAFVGKEPERWATVMPMVGCVSDLFASVLPVRYARQREEALKAPRAYVIGETPFSTLTVNNNVVGAIHQDKGDFKDGFGVISVVRRGEYSGAWLVFPEYSVGVDLRDGDVLFFNSHDWHGVTPFREAREGYERISVVYYFRARMVECGSPAQEIERARKRYGSLEE